MIDEGLRLGIAAGEAESQIAFGEFVDLDLERSAQRRVERQQPAIVEIARGHRIGIGAKKRLDALVHRAEHVNPAELMNRSVDAGTWRLFCILGVVGRRLELKLVEQVVGRLVAGLALNGEAGKILCALFVEIERQQRLGVAPIGRDR